MWLSILDVAFRSQNLKLELLASSKIDEKMDPEGGYGRRVT